MFITGTSLGPLDNIANLSYPRIICCLVDLAVMTYDNDGYLMYDGIESLV